MAPRGSWPDVRAAIANRCRDDPAPSFRAVAREFGVDRHTVSRIAQASTRSSNAAEPQQRPSADSETAQLRAENHQLRHAVRTLKATLALYVTEADA